MSNQPVAAQTATTATGTVSQVAWQFVVQYYTYMNDKPDQLHRFYTKSSHYLHGIEGEDTDLLQGQTAIHKKFVEIGFKDCKVFIHSVDAHPSANNGILVHVIGEMSNRGEAWKKFVQVFFLAEQQNGYFVLNDNFRFLKEETFDEEEENPDDHQLQSEQGPPSVAEDVSYNQPHTNGYHGTAEATSVQQPPTIAAPAPIPAVTAPVPITPKETPAPPAVPESTYVEPAPRPPTPTPEPALPTVPDVIEPTQEPVSTPPAAPSPVPARKSPSPAPPSALPPSTEAPSQPATPQPAGPPAPKTWASLAATNSSKWGQNVAQEAKGVSAAAPHPAAGATQAQPPRERAGGNAPTAPSAGGDPVLQPGGVGPRNIPPANQHPLYAAALSVTTAMCFVKGVTENIPQQALEQVLSTRFGPIKEVEIVRSKACAFIEFKSIDSAKKAIIASLHPGAGGEGGIRFDEEKYGSPARINVETRKERGDRPAPRGRGGVSVGVAGEGRGVAGGSQTGGGSPGGSYRGRGGPRGRGDGTRGKA
ncbi:Putative G3BP-like protein [Serendipita indica DSM 11827]|uniref:Ras-GTPase-activating protein binding protein 2 n=1 Tax=Serendipita indica (strain DSM 11827) TaxID=1109443 RepID=G4T7L6_SERID|nr:Putative G3BP-like protein [Serendipita indica DSM 11827]CCA67320.1 hypothetical protein PIIN_01151 [Serendipita indica DSM 11827]